MGLVGFGDIAQATARRLAPFGCRLYYYSLHRRSPEVEADFGVTYLPLEDLVSVCDLLSLHCAVNDQTRNMVDVALLSRFKPGAILVNTARGDLVDNWAVRQALIDGRLGGAAFDTLAPEPTPADHPLVALPPEVQEAALQHEVYHIEHDHMYNLDPVAVNEREANERPSRIVEQPVPASAAALHCAQHMSGRCAPDESAAAGTNASSSPRCVAAPTVRAPRAALDEQSRQALHAWLEKRLYDVG